MTDIFSAICDITNLYEAFFRVRANGGCRGSDGITIRMFERRLEKNLKELNSDLSKFKYTAFPLLRFAVPKRNTKSFRYLSVPTVRDRVAQTATFLVTRDIFESEFENISHAYREGRGVKTAVYAIKQWADKGYRYAVDADIDDYFDTIDHHLLLKKLRQLIPEENVIGLFEKWIKAEIYDGQRIWPLQKGIPQGSVVSPLLANLFLDELDETLTEFGLKLVRYADDFIILCKTPAAAEEAIEITDMLLEDLKLELNPEKTKIVNFDQGFKFLGAIFLHHGIYLPFPQKRKKVAPPLLPPPLTLKRYLELRS